MLGTARGIFSKTKDRVDDALWRGGAWLRLRNDPMAALVPAEFRRDAGGIIRDAVSIASQVVLQDTDGLLDLSEICALVNEGLNLQLSTLEYFCHWAASRQQEFVELVP